MMDSRQIKLWLCIACLSVTLAAPAAKPELYLDIIDMAAISRMSPQQLETLAEGLAAEEIMRTKRSSAHALTSIAAKASSGLQSKLGFLGQASAFISSASKSGESEHHGYSYEPQHHDEKYDYWGLKKSILYTLFQAVKAITGGVTILKGQLIKGSGALASTLGKAIAGKGDVVSNLGKKIVSSAALSEKKVHHVSPVYGPPQTSHIEYGTPTAYGAPTAPAVISTQYAAGHTLTDHTLTGHTLNEHIHGHGPSYGRDAVPTGFSPHKFLSSLDGRSKLSGAHAGLVFLTPLEHTAPETLETAHSGYTPLEPPSSIIHTVFSAIKNAFSTVPVPSAPAPIEEPYAHQPPPPIQAVPEFKPMGWGNINSYGEPATADAYIDYDPRNPHPPFQYATPKHSPVPTHKTGLTPEKIQKINFNLKKLNHYVNQQARSSEDLPKFNGLDVYKNGPLMPTQVVSDNEIGVLPAELLPEPETYTTTTTSTTTTTTTTTTTEKPKSTTVETQRKDFKYFLRGNRIVLV